jgi:hypothetical protein
MTLILDWNGSWDNWHSDNRSCYVWYNCMKLLTGLVWHKLVDQAYKFGMLIR